MKNSQGFTLIELILAISLLALVVTVTYSSLGNIIETKVILEDQREIRQIANASVVRLARELQLAYEGIARLPPQNDLTKRYHSSDNLLGEYEQIGDTVFSRITFVALSGGQYMPDGETHTGIVQISYYIRENPEYNSSLNTNRYVLVREEIPYIRPFEKAYEKQMVFPLTEEIIGFNLRYFDADRMKWNDTWGEEGSQATDGLPAIVQFTLSFRSERGKEESYTTAVPLRSSRNS